MRRDVFQAIADPKRRAIIQMLSLNRMTISEVAKEFKVSLPAISKHLKILEGCGLVVIEQQGRERYCQARLEKLAVISAWVNEYSRFWQSRLEDLKKTLETKNDKNNEYDS
jgi:DNA-binding transcriptional ArsR family regulator